MKNIRIKDINLNGMPKICVPVTGVTENEILGEFNKLKNTPLDLVELRADYFEFVKDQTKVTDLLEKIRKLYDKPLLFTLRTKKEGGVSYINTDYYFKLNKNVIESKLVELIDIEFFSQAEGVDSIVDLARKNMVVTILSNHDFLKTPPEEEIISRVNKMMDCGDIAKIAVMPNSEEDVLTLLSAALKLKKEKKGPFIAISMGPLGIISRISCELIGSCMTYASHKDKSAPGQIDAKLIKEIIKIMHI
ncbi:MAG: type I 3-dehydroquinate dehydratase [Tissierellia bacterium]|nr:type I 3-dehydroquinate dehydratase [Tissierellia bacterium]MDD3751020.1 type I 3-dehydroquinate dehydratase [Tissierellia bacterium]MDD4678599.1 type I 3-dehydroquinate dehydratase [Tissierellia bacterium]